MAKTITSAVRAIMKMLAKISCSLIRTKTAAL